MYGSDTENLLKDKVMCSDNRESSKNKRRYKKYMESLELSMERKRMNIQNRMLFIQSTMIYFTLINSIFLCFSCFFSLDTVFTNAVLIAISFLQVLLFIRNFEKINALEGELHKNIKNKIKVIRKCNEIDKNNRS